MAYFVTGATGFIGRYLVANLLRRGQPDLRAGPQGFARRSSRRCASAGAPTTSRSSASRATWPSPNLGVSAADLKKLKGKIDHLFHLAAIYDLKASAEAQQIANVDGTQNTVRFAGSGRRGLLPSRELDRGRRASTTARSARTCSRRPKTSIIRTSRPSTTPKAVVRRECKRPFRVYRPGFVVGHSKTGRDRQDRRPLLLLQDAAEDARDACRRGCR